MTMEHLAVADLAQRCREETQRFLRGEPRDDAYYFEIFQRAVVNRDNDAWQAIVAQYRGILLAYVSQHTPTAMLNESDDYWINRAFQRFWSAIGPDRFGRFPDLAALLKYLKLCVHSVLMDEARARRANLVTSIDEAPESAAVQSDAEGGILGKVSGEQLWATIARVLQDEAEEKVIFLSFARDMKPAEIFQRYPQLYRGVADVYRIKRNVLERLRNNAEVRAFLPT